MSAESLESRFWEKVNRDRTEHQCWLWTAGTNSSDYGSMKVDGTHTNAHRIAYRLEVEDPGDKFVLHQCDNKQCVNPNHLYLGTPSQNMQDMYDRGRRDATGENNPNAKLDSNDVETIRERSDSETNRELADEFGVASSTISMIVTGRLWSNE